MNNRAARRRASRKTDPKQTIQMLAFAFAWADGKDFSTLTEQDWVSYLNKVDEFFNAIGGQ